MGSQAFLEHSPLIRVPFGPLFRILLIGDVQNKLFLEFQISVSSEAIPRCASLLHHFLTTRKS